MPLLDTRSNKITLEEASRRSDQRRAEREAARIERRAKRESARNSREIRKLGGGLQEMLEAKRAREQPQPPGMPEVPKVPLPPFPEIPEEPPAALPPPPPEAPPEGPIAAPEEGPQEGSPEIGEDMSAKLAELAAGMAQALLNQRDIKDLKEKVSILEADVSDKPSNTVVVQGTDSSFSGEEQPATSGEEKDHSWHFTATDATTGSIGNALLYYQGEKQTIAESSSAITGSGPWDLTLSALNTHVYLEADTSSTPTFTLKTGTSFPDAGSETRIYPILEFTDSGDTETCIEHQQSDIHLDIPPHKNGSSDHAVLVNNGGVIEWAEASNDYEVLQRKEDNSLGFDWPRFNVGTP